MSERDHEGRLPQRPCVKCGRPTPPMPYTDGYYKCAPCALLPGLLAEEAGKADAREALSECARRITRWREQHGPEACAVLSLAEKMLREVIGPALSAPAN